MKKTHKRVIQSLVKRLEAGEFGTAFKVRKHMNNRGDYGYSETYSRTDGEFPMPLWEISFDGARVDTQYFINPAII